LNDGQDSYRNPRDAYTKHGVTYIVIVPEVFLVRTSNAELVSQIVTRKNDFVKPVDVYKVLDIFGRSLITLEDHDWRRYRKVVGPSFSEKSNKLVFEDSLRQARGMVDYWASQYTNTPKDIQVQNAAPDAAVLGLHVICATGFGLRQIWPNEKEKVPQNNSVMGPATNISKKE